MGEHFFGYGNEKLHKVVGSHKEFSPKMEKLSLSGDPPLVGSPLGTGPYSLPLIIIQLKTGD